MTEEAKKHLLFLGLFIIFLITLPLTIYYLQKKQEQRSKATASTTLSFSPVSSATNSIQKNVGNPISLDVMINPGVNLVSLVTLEIKYDSFVFQPSGQSPFVINSAVFPTVVEGPILNNGDYLITLSVGSDPTKAVQTPTKIGTLTLVAMNPTFNGPSVISFGTNSKAFSVASTDAASENVLSSATPDYIVVSALPTPTPTQTLTPTPTPSPTATSTPPATPTPTSTPFPTLTPFPTITPIPMATNFSFTVYLHGIGNSGDSTNPDSSLSNKNPLHFQRNLSVFVYDANNALVLQQQGTINYNNVNGFFNGTINMGTTLQSGNYTVKVKSDSYLRRLIPGIQSITAGTTNIMPAVTLVAGDFNGDNVINIIDYNMLTGCYSDLLPPTFCDQTRKNLTDITDDGNVNQYDYNLFLREINVQHGD